jgi:hypothetical protein
MLPIAAVALAGASLSTIAAPATSSKLASLIEAHRAAEVAFAAMCTKQDEADWAYSEARTAITFSCLGRETILVPGIVGFEHCRNGIEHWFQMQRALASIGNVGPHEAAQVLAVLDSKEAESMALLDQAVDREDAQREAFGLAAIEREYRAVSDAEDAAFMAICAYTCRSAEEYRLKAEYLIGLHERRDGFQTEHVRALLQSLAGAPAV